MSFSLITSKNVETSDRHTHIHIAQDPKCLSTTYPPNTYRINPKYWQKSLRYFSGERLFNSQNCNAESGLAMPLFKKDRASKDITSGRRDIQQNYHFKDILGTGAFSKVILFLLLFIIITFIIIVAILIFFLPIIHNNNS